MKPSGGWIIYAREEGGQLFAMRGTVEDFEAVRGTQHIQGEPVAYIAFALQLDDFDFILGSRR